MAVLAEPPASRIVLRPKDLDETFIRGSGAGGQHRNKTSTTVVLHHLPTGLRVRVDGGRSQHANRQTAMALLRARLDQARRRSAYERRNAARQAQVGSGMRGDKVRTVQVKNGLVVDHRSGGRIAYKRYARGDVAGLFSATSVR